MLEFIQSSLLIIFLTLASYWDLRERRIPNWLTMAGVAISICMAFAIWLSGGNVGPNMFGMTVAVFVMLLLYLGGGVGGGDVKLAITFGFLSGYPNVVQYIFYGSLAALILILTRLAWAGETYSVLKKIAKSKPHIIHPSPTERDEPEEEIKKRSTSFSVALLLAVIWVWILAIS
ncbi:MAG: prepilin peptidase [Planctomycetes bacterium]|nr:prepilin peptidase [Planctomycetota bacterium]